MRKSQFITRILATFMCAAMLMGILPATAFAVSGLPDSSVGTEEQVPDSSALIEESNAGSDSVPLDNLQPSDTNSSAEADTSIPADNSVDRILPVQDRPTEDNTSAPEAPALDASDSEVPEDSSLLSEMPAAPENAAAQPEALVAGEAFLYDGLYYVVLPDTSTVEVGNNQAYSGENLSIPAEVQDLSGNKYTVVAIGFTAFAGSATGPAGILTLPDSLKIIHNDAFYNCSNLTDINFPAALSHIGREAFYGCTGLTGTLTLPAGLSTMGNALFSGCTGLEAFDIAESNANFCTRDGLLYNKDQTVLRACPPGIANRISIPDTVASISDYVFYSCTNLTSICFPTNLITIGDYAFANCTALDNVDFPASLATIGEHAFAGAGLNGTVSLPISLTNVGKNAFGGCTGLEAFSAHMGNAVLSSEEGLLYNKSKTTLITCPPGKTGTLILPPGLIIIREGAFGGCVKLTGVDLPDSVTHIENSAFEGCAWLTGSLDLPDSLISVGNYAFAYCPNITAISFPATFTGMGTATFISCTGVNLLSFRSLTPPAIGIHALLNLSLTGTIVYPYGANYEAVSPPPGWAKVSAAHQPAVQTQPTDASYELGYAAQPLTITASASDMGILSYQWYQSSVNSTNGMPIDGATANTFTPPTAAARVTYFYAVVTNTNGSADISTACIISNIAVVKVSAVPVVDVRVNPAISTLKVGEVQQLSAIITPGPTTNQTISWSTSNAFVAVVSTAGLVTAVGKGTANIVVTTSDGNKTAICAVTVQPADNSPGPPGPTDSEKARVDKDALTADTIKGGNTYIENVTSDLTLPTTGANGSTITWAADPLGYIDTATGAIKRPASGQPDVSATLTAIVKYGSASETVSFSITIKAEEAVIASVKLAQGSIRLNAKASATIGVVAYWSDGSTTTSGVTWASSNTRVATVSNKGTITAKSLSKKGSTTITATAENGQSAKIKVTVLKKGTANVAATTVSISGAKKMLTVGKSLQLKAKISPSSAMGAAVTWKSSKSSVLHVDKAGKLTALKEGAAKITLKAGGKSVSVTVTVTAPVAKLRLESRTLNLKVNKSTTLVPVITLSEESYTVKPKLTWISSNKAVATVSSKGKVTAKVKGTATITVKAANGKKATIKITVK